jgi:hypothetical protein
MLAVNISQAFLFIGCAYAAWMLAYVARESVFDLCTPPTPFESPNSGGPKQMTSEAILHELSGGEALFKWFGRVPHFHDANLLQINLSNQEPCFLRVHTWR